MKRRNFVPAMLALTLAGPMAAPAANALSPAQSAQLQPQRQEAFSASQVDLAGLYLRCRAQGEKASEQSCVAWGEFYQSCDRVIRRFANTFESRGVDVDDCVQEVWADLVESLPDFQLDRSRGKFTSWLYTVVRSKATDMIRRNARHRCGEVDAEVADDSAGPADELIRNSDIAAVRDALATLKDIASVKSYQVLYMRQMEGREVREVAHALGMKPGQVWVTEHRMKKKLGKLLSCTNS